MIYCFIRTLIKGPLQRLMLQGREQTIHPVAWWGDVHNDQVTAKTLILLQNWLIKSACSSRNNNVLFDLL